MIILGLNAHHADAAACILRDGVPVAAVAEERLSRIKHHAGYPEAAIKECLRLAKLEPGDIDAVAVNRDNRAQIWHKLAYVLRHPPKPGLLLQKLRNRRDWAALPDLLADNNTVTAPLTAIDHHQAHLACARYACPSPADRTVCTVSVDGFGDFTGAAWGATGPFEGTVLAEPQVLGRIRFPHSLGIFYQALTQFLGFPHYGDEYKVMGLAARGTPDPGLTEAVGALVPVDSTGRFSLALGAFRHHRDAVPYEWKGGQPVVGALYAPALSEQLGPARAPEDPMEPRHAALAWAVQSVFEDRLCALLGLAHRDCPTDDLALAGGCAQNSLANGLIAARTPFRRIHIPAAPADDGGALGAALVLHGRLTGSPPPGRKGSGARLGTPITTEAVSDLLHRPGTTSALEVEQVECVGPLNQAQLIERTVALLLQGAVIGWAQGAMEWGPRALGGRSILADPRQADMRERLNAKIKRRESFRPFAPSVLADHVGDWFEPEAPDLPAEGSPVMAKVLRFRPGQGEKVAAVHHLDGTARIQAVSREDDPLFHALIQAFYQRSGVPMLLNTSFNENEPIVRSPAEALDCFLRTGMDALVLDRMLMVRSGADSIPEAHQNGDQDIDQDRRP